MLRAWDAAKGHSGCCNAKGSRRLQVDINVLSFPLWEGLTVGLAGVKDRGCDGLDESG